MWFLKKKKTQAEPTPPPKPIAPLKFNFECNISGVVWGNISAEKNPEYDTDYETLKEAYDIGEKIFEYEYVAKPEEITINMIGSKYHVYLNGQDVGYIPPKRSAELAMLEREKNIVELRAEFYNGCFRKIVRDDYYDDEDEYFDRDDPDCKWVDNDQLEKPKGFLTVVYTKKDA